MKATLRAALCGVALTGTYACAGGSDTAAPWRIPVVVVSYFPVAGDSIDMGVTGDWGASLENTRRKTGAVTDSLIEILEAGSRYHFYRNPGALPSLRYEVVDRIERLEPLPTIERSDGRVPLTDYREIFASNGLRRLVEDEGVKEIWLWGYHGGVLDLWESNMSGPWGDVSNSDRNPDDLPVLATTYTLYHYNYQRGASEATENHMHQLEAVLNFVDGRDTVPEDEWGDLLFWGRFVGSDVSHRIIRPGCGWSHIPPNGERDYDWANHRVVRSDCDDWTPDGNGRTRDYRCALWNCTGLGWFVRWTQNIPGRGNRLRYHGRALTDWWRFIGDFDGAMSQGVTLVQP